MSRASTVATAAILFFLLSGCPKEEGKAPPVSAPAKYVPLFDEVAW